MERLKILWAKALRKVGVSIHDRVFMVKCEKFDFIMINEGARSVIITEYDEKFKLGSLIRLCEFDPVKGDYTDREAHCFIKDIIRPGTKGLFPYHCVLTLE